MPKYGKTFARLTTNPRKANEENQRKHAMITSIEPKFGSWNADILKAAFRTDGRAEAILPATPPGGWILLVGPRQVNAAMLTAIARLGEGTQVRVLDGGNRFNAYTVARLVRGRPEVLEHITVARAFTCYQVLALLESTPATACACVVLDLLNTFYDESVQAGERKRLLRACLAQLERLGQCSNGVSATRVAETADAQKTGTGGGLPAPVAQAQVTPPRLVVSVHPPKVPSQAAVEMLALLQASALDTIFIQPEPAAPEPLRLF
jgi:hypothetical protein